MLEGMSNRSADMIVYPKLRGVLHLATFPISIAVSAALIALSPTSPMRGAVIVYAVTTMLLFGNSALLHMSHGRWGRRVNHVILVIDYSNIFLTIAGTNTPFIMALEPRIRWPYLAAIWAAATVGIVCHLIWPHGHDQIFTAVYIVLGLAPVSLLPMLWASPFIGPTVTLIIAAGGVAEVAGAICFALRKPNPLPAWFGYHELFHLGTVIGYACHATALFLTLSAMR